MLLKDTPENDPHHKAPTPWPLTTTGCDVIGILEKFSFLDISQDDSPETKDIKKELYSIMRQEIALWHLTIDKLWHTISVCAPNGEASTLFGDLMAYGCDEATALRSWLLVRITRFKQRFWDRQTSWGIVDSNWEPMVLRHTTMSTTGFEYFDINRQWANRLGKGFYLAAQDYWLWNNADKYTFYLFSNAKNLKRYDNGDFTAAVRAYMGSNDLDDDELKEGREGVQAADKQAWYDWYVSTAPTWTEYCIFAPDNMKSAVNNSGWYDDTAFLFV